jgi:hypothetical protein
MTLPSTIVELIDSLLPTANESIKCAGCQSALKRGSDSLLMELGCLSGLGSPREFDAVSQTFRASALVPRGFVVDEVTSDARAR